MNILIADDHFAMVASLKTIISFAFEEVENLVFIEAFNCEEAILKTHEFLLENKTFNLAVLDYIMPPFVEKQIANGGDLCSYIKKVMPSCKTLINTGVVEDFTLFEIDQIAKPDALTLKSDISTEEYINVCKKIMKGEKFRSYYVQEKIQQIWEQQTFAQEINRQIVKLLTEGYKINEIAETLSLSPIAIQKRIVKIKLALKITDNTSVLREVKRLGYI